MKNAVKDGEMVQHNMIKGETERNHDVISESTPPTAVGPHAATLRRCPHTQMHRNISHDPSAGKAYKSNE